MRKMIFTALLIIAGIRVFAQDSPLRDSAFQRERKEFSALLKNKRDQEANNAAYDYFMAHPDRYSSLDLFQPYVLFMEQDSVRKVFDSFSPALKNTELGKKMAAQFAIWNATAPGNASLNFELTDLNGTPMQLSSLRGKYVIVDFWGSWCHPCRASHPHLREFYAKYKDKGLDILGVANELRPGRAEEWKKAVAEDSIGIWHHVLDDKGTISDQYGIMAFPTKFLIDPSGKILVKEIGDTKKIDATLKELLD